MTICSFVNFLLIFLRPENPNIVLMIPFTLQRTFFWKIWGIRCKFSVNFHCDFLSLSLYNGQIFPSHITTYIFSSKSRYPIKKIFCFHTKWTFFRQMDTRSIVKFLLTASCTLSTVQRTFFCQKAGLRLKIFSTNGDTPAIVKFLLTVSYASLTFNGHF